MTTLIADSFVLDAAARVSVPRAAPADSFVLHAPLELMARVGLLPFVAADERGAAVAALRTFVEHYEASGPPADPPAVVSFAASHDAASALDRALRDGDLDTVDAATTWLAENCSHRQLRHLVAESVVDSLAAAGHAPIGLHLLARVAGGALPATLLRGPLREVARHPDWRITWFRNSPDPDEEPDEPASLASALTAVPQLGRPGSDFIYPLMAQVERAGVGTRVLGPTLGDRLDPAVARRTLQRAAVWSMVHDDPAQAPYGWSHALTMPQAVMSLAGDGADVRTAVAVAATFLAGFRAAHGLTPLGSLEWNFAGDPRRVPDLASYASRHHDAHLVKYTLACLHAASDDPAWRNEYLAAAGYLADWWRAAGD
jgi:hypothetical protein